MRRPYPTPRASRRVGVQQRFAPNSICFGCGPANPQGLHLASEEDPEGGLATSFAPQAHHTAFEGFVSGGILSVLLDCHCNWTAAMELMRARGIEGPAPTVTAELAVKMRRPTPLQPLTVRSRVAELLEDRAWIEGSVHAGDVVTATARGLFVMVRPGHPAYSRW